MKLTFWDILASLFVISGLALAVIFINIFINPYSFINPFPPPTPASTSAPSLTPSQQSLPQLWTGTPETPGVPSLTGLPPSETAAPTAFHWVFPTSTPFKTFTRTPNWVLTINALRTATNTSTASTDTTPPTLPGIPRTDSATNNPTPLWYWSMSNDSGSGLRYYQVTWGGDVNCNNNVYVTATNNWTAPVITANANYYICVRARDVAGNYSNWVGPAGFYYSGPVANPTVTRTPTRTHTPVLTNTVTLTFTPSLSPTNTSTGVLPPTATSTFTSTATTIPSTATSTSTYTATLPVVLTDTPTATYTVAIPPTETATETATAVIVPTETETPTETSTYTITPTETATTEASVTPTFTTVPSTYTISGSTGVGPTMTPTGDPVPAVTISVTGDPGAIVTQPDGYGNYSVVVPANWSGVITPSRIGYKFTPVKYEYTHVNANMSNQNFTSEETATFTITGNIGAAPGSTVTANNGAVVTVQPELDGNYEVVVYAGWSGTIKVTNPSCTFTPPQHDYTNVTGALTDQNFTPACP